VNASIRSWLGRLSTDPMSRFLPLFFLYLGLIVALNLPIVGLDEFANFLGRQTASLSSLLLGGLGEGAEVVGKTVTFKGFNVIVVGECAGLLEFMMFAAAVVAYPAKWGSRLIGLLLAIPIVFGFNVFRIMGLVVIGKYQPTLFHFAHVYLWQATMVLMIAGLWIAWVRFVVIGNDRTPLRS
jgi:exosortase H (IPTLxxWG-CTERM-specific)